MSSIHQITEPTGSQQPVATTSATSADMPRPKCYQYIRPLAYEPCVRSRLGFWAGDARIGSPEDLQRHIHHEDAPGPLFNGIITQTTRIGLLELQVRMKDREIEGLRSSLDRQESALLTPSMAAQGPKRKVLKADVDLEDPGQQEPASPVESASSKEPLTSKKGLESQDIPQARRSPEQVESSSLVVNTAKTEDSHTASSIQRHSELKPEEPFRFIIPQTEALKATPYTIAKPTSPFQAPSRSDNRPRSLPTCDFSFTLPLRPAPTVAPALIESKKVQPPRCDSSQLLQDDDASSPDTLAVPDPEVFSGDPNAFAAFEEQLFWKMAKHGDKFEDEAAKHAYVLSRLAGEALELVARTTLDQMGSDQDTDSDDDTQTWQVVMRTLFKKYDQYLSESEEEEEEHDAESEASHYSCPSGVDEAGPDEPEGVPEPEVLTGEPYVATEDEALAAAEKMAARETSERHRAQYDARYNQACAMHLRRVDVFKGDRNAGPIEPRARNPPARVEKRRWRSWTKLPSMPPGMGGEQ
ncbi:hypothetical protein BKA81DRAFT_400701 [Phyllosticta paracitricarpa]